MPDFIYLFSSAQEDSKADIHNLIRNKPVPLWSKCRFLILAKIGLFLRPFFIYNRKLSANRYYHFKRRIHMQNYLIVFLISMVPLIALRGAIPYAESDLAFRFPRLTSSQSSAI